MTILEALQKLIDCPELSSAAAHTELKAAVAASSRPTVPLTSPTLQQVITALVTLGFVIQSD